MALHFSGKLCAVGLVLAALITAFSAPPKEEKPFDLLIDPAVTVLSAPREIGAVAETPGPVSNPVYSLKATGYNSLVNQTDDTPDITSTGVKTTFGVIAVSRDLLKGDLPYGSLVRIRDLGNYYNGRAAGRFQDLLDSQNLFIVEDTMHARKRGQIDVWFPHMADAVNWGVRQVEVEVIRYGRNGPEIYAQTPSDFVATPSLSATH